jgi:hypothetical protein
MAEEEIDDEIDYMEDHLNCFVHNFTCFKW